MKLRFLSPFWIVLALSPLPFFYFAWSMHLNLSELSEVAQHMERVQQKEMLFEGAQKRQSAHLSSSQPLDSSYLDKYIESLTFLEPEIKKLESLPPDNQGDEWVQKRLQFLKEGPNRLQFAEEHLRTADNRREMEEAQQHPVEMDEEDLKKLLCLTEGVMIWPYGPKEGRPVLIIKDFQLVKREQPSHDRVFSVNMKLIKRELIGQTP